GASHHAPERKLSVRALWVVLAVGCGNSLPPPGTCDVVTSGETVDVQMGGLPLPGGGPAADDGPRYSAELVKGVPAPQGTGVIALIDPDTMAIQAVNVPRGVASADASATTVYGADRANHRIVAFDVASGAMVGTGSLPGSPDYVRYSPTTDEVWVTIP